MEEIMIRKIIQIDSKKCNGCGACATACHEGAIAMVDGKARLMPFFNEPNNPDLLISVQTAGVYNEKKDKRREKLAETDEDRLENRTDGSDAFDTLYIGCERFPQQPVQLVVTGGG